MLVNDRPDVALAAGAAGVHLGPDDLPVELARRHRAAGLRRSARRSGLEAEAAAARDADYWGIGPWRVTSTKGDAGAALGPEGFGAWYGAGGGTAVHRDRGGQAGGCGEVRGAGRRRAWRWSPGSWLRTTSRRPTRR